MGSESPSKSNSNDLYLNQKNYDSSEGLGVPRTQQRRHRLYSDPQQLPTDSEKLQPIRRHSNIIDPNLTLNLHNSIGTLPEKKEDSNYPLLSETTRQRKYSQKYCSAFKNSYSSKGVEIYLNHLAESLNHNQNAEIPDFEKIREKYLPQYMYDWRYIVDPNTKVKYWKNFGKIIIDSNMFEKIRKLSDHPIGASEPFYLKRNWLFSYLIRRFGRGSLENPIISINRNNIFEDSYNKFIKTKELTLTKPLKIRFINEKLEDVDGIYREWYSCMFRAMLSPNLRLFMINPYKSYEPNTILFYPKYPGMKLEYYVFIGKLLIKAIVDLMVIRNMKLNHVLLKGIIKRPITLDDIKYYNFDLYQQLKYINDTPVMSNPQLQQIRFVWKIRNENNLIQEVEIIQGGKNIFLNDNNKLLFIDKVIYTETIRPYEEQIKAIQKGIYSIFEGVLEGVFSVEELAFLLSGQDNIDLNDWKENTIYKGCYNPNHPVIKMFWEKIGTLKKNEIIKFLQFSTGSESVPIDGFGSLKGIGGKIQKFTIEPFTNYSAENPDDYKFQKIESKRCYHTIILPLYQNRQELDKAINIILNDTK